MIKSGAEAISNTSRVEDMNWSKNMDWCSCSFYLTNVGMTFEGRQVMQGM